VPVLLLRFHALGYLETFDSIELDKHRRSHSNDGEANPRGPAPERTFLGEIGELRRPSGVAVIDSHYYCDVNGKPSP
jgi:hypothetical protein